MKVQFQIAIYLLFLTSCVVSATQRPGHQIISKGILNQVKDTVKVHPFFSYSNSFEDNQQFKNFAADNKRKINDSIQFIEELGGFLSAQNFKYKLVSDSLNSFLIDSIVSRLSDWNQVELSSLFYSNINSQDPILIVYANFNVNQNLGYSTLGPSGQTKAQYQITSRALIIKDNVVMYHRSNFLNSLFKEKVFYRKSISRILSDAFKKKG